MGRSLCGQEVAGQKYRGRMESISRSFTDGIQPVIDWCVFAGKNMDFSAARTDLKRSIYKLERK